MMQLPPQVVNLLLGREIESIFAIRFADSYFPVLFTTTPVSSIVCCGVVDCFEMASTEQ